MQFGDRGQIDARVRVHVVLHVGRKRDLMVRVRGREWGEAGTVEVDPVVVEEVWILAGVHAVGAEPDLPLLLVDLLDAANRPLALRDLVLDRPRGTVEQVEVVPAVAFRHPDDLAPVPGVVAELLARSAVARRLVAVSYTHLRAH